MPKTIELNEESTHEDIEAAVEQIVSEVEGEREESKSDAQITTEHTDTTTDLQESDEDTAADSGSEKTGKENQEADDDWLTEDLRAEAAAVGIDEKTLEEFASREELDRAFRILDRNLDAERKKVLGEREKEKPEPEKTEKPAETDGKYEVKLNRDVYDDEIVEEFTRMRDHYESRLAALEERLQTVDAAAEEERFDRSVDALEFAQLFGKTGEESESEMARRKELFEHVQVEQTVMERLGRNVSYDTLVQRVARSLFPDQYDKKLIRNHTRKISRQSDKRQGGGATRPTDPPESPREEADRLYREMAGV